ncbi:TonB system transport protein ExbD [uncultured Amaricoccus sp.]|uniref:TonB system transport protein ExbD n=1 Tax=uncultured Amaricoccus sp. TaxID=339341 RepID=UPI002614D7FD|nr:TonB system transport protein ExbD [uncultured Amaricoccus sp.]
MAGSLRQRGSGDDLEVTHEINVTPFIDVMLVLLIIFMIAAPLATVDVPVDLPGSTATPRPRPADPIFLTVRADKSLDLGEQPVAPEALGPALDALAKGDKETRVFLRADKTVTYGDLTEAMNLLRSAGYLKVALVSLETPPPATP